MPNYTWTGTATVTVTGGSSTPTVSAVAAPPTGPGTCRRRSCLPFGANQYTPSLTALSALNYAPIPLSVALDEYLPSVGFRARHLLVQPSTRKIKANSGQNQGRASGINTLSSHVYDRSLFHAQKTYSWTHKTAKVGIVSGVVPSSRSDGVLRRQPAPLIIAAVTANGSRKSDDGALFHGAIVEMSSVPALSS